MRLSFPKADLRLYGVKEGDRSRLSGRDWEGGKRTGIEDAHQANTAEAAAEGLVKDGAVEGQLLKVALRQPDIN